MKKYCIALSILLVSIVIEAQLPLVFQTNGIAIRGYDPVAFFKQAKPVAGHDSLSYNWNDATWKFATSENMALFSSQPEKYAPQYGGYCAYGMSNGYKAPTEIDTWTVLDGKLYLNYNKKVQESWNKNRHDFIEKADKLWPTVKDKK